MNTIYIDYSPFTMYSKATITNDAENTVIAVHSIGSATNDFALGVLGLSDQFDANVVRINAPEVMLPGLIDAVKLAEMAKYSKNNIVVEGM